MNVAERAVRWLSRESLPYFLRPRNPSGLVRLGSTYGGWTVPADLVDAGSVCYSFGVGEDVSFDIALAKRTGAVVHLFDPTPRSKKHLELLALAQRGNAAAAERLRDSYGDLTDVPIDLLQLHEVGVWCEDLQMEFFEPSNPEHVSHSVVNLQGTQVGFTAMVRTVRSIAAELGHEHVDFMKFDIEGAELAVIDDLLEHGPLPSALCVELDAIARGKIGKFFELKALVAKMAKQGLFLAHIEDWNFLFILESGPMSAN